MFQSDQLDRPGYESNINLDIWVLRLEVLHDSFWFFSQLNSIQVQSAFYCLRVIFINKLNKLRKFSVII